MEKHNELDLLTAALLGAMVGAGVALMVGRTGGRKRTFKSEMSRAAAVGARRARGWGRQGAKWASGTGEELVDRIPVKEMRKQVSSYFDSVRDAIDDTVSAELDDLRKTIRKRRRKLGV